MTDVKNIQDTTVWLVRDDFDQTSVCVVQCNHEIEALLIAKGHFADDISGDLYAIELPLLTTEAK